MAPDHRMADFSSRSSKSQVTVTTQSAVSTRSQPVTQIPIGLSRTPTGKACGAALGAIYYPIAGQASSADASSSSSDNASLDRMSLPHSRSYENADTLERGDCTGGFHTAKGDKRLSCPASSVGSLSRTNKVTRPITTFNPLDREKYKTAGESKRESQTNQGFESHPASQNVHSDMYSTAFALQSLGDGTWPSYLNKVRSIWDDQLQHRSADNIHEKSIMGNGSGVIGGQARSKRSKSQGQYHGCQMFVPFLSGMPEWLLQFALSLPFSCYDFFFSSF